MMKQHEVMSLTAGQEVSVWTASLAEAARGVSGNLLLYLDSVLKGT